MNDISNQVLVEYFCADILEWNRNLKISDQGDLSGRAFARSPKLVRASEGKKEIVVKNINKQQPMRGLMIKFRVNKLGRDKGVETFKAEGVTTHHRILAGKELRDALLSKLIEEAAEVKEADSQKEVIAELADVLEVIDGLCKAYNINPDELARVKEKKREERGGFQKGLFIKSVEMDESNPKVNHFRSSSGRYPEE